MKNCAVSSRKNSRFIKQQEASSIICSLAETFSNIPIVGLALF